MAQKVIEQLVNEITFFYQRHILKRIPFNYNRVASGWGFEGAGLPHYSNRLHKEVNQLKKAIGDYRAHKTLEIGCGYGRLSPWIQEYSKELFSVEPQLDLIQDAEILNPGVKFYNTQVQNMPFPDDYFDLCVSWTVLQHIPPGKEFIKAINEIKRVCKPNARIILGEETEGSKGKLCWSHPIDEWVYFFSPWKLTFHTERKIEVTFKGHAGTIMRFEHS